MSEIQDFIRMYEEYMNERSVKLESMLEEDRWWRKRASELLEEDCSIKRFGLDFHGVIDRCPDMLSVWSKEMVSKGHEVHIVTGSRWTEELKEILKKLNFERGVSFTHFFSITDYHVDKGTDVKFNKKGFPFMDEDLWNRTKGVMASLWGLDVMWDDSPTYGRYFPFTCQYIRFSPENFMLEAKEALEGRPCIGRHKIK